MKKKITIEFEIDTMNGRTLDSELAEHITLHTKSWFFKEDKEIWHCEECGETTSEEWLWYFPKKVKVKIRNFSKNK